jgi:hypothetical protein
LESRAVWTNNAREVGLADEKFLDIRRDKVNALLDHVEDNSGTKQDLTPDELELVQLIARLDGKTADQFSATKIRDILEQAMLAGDLPDRDLTMVLTKPFGRWRIPLDAIDKTAEMIGKPVAFVGGIQPNSFEHSEDLLTPKPTTPVRAHLM